MSRQAVAIPLGMAPRDAVEYVRRAEALGYESAWMAEGHGGDHFAIFAACAQVTNTIQLGTSVTSVYVRSAPTIAMAAATVDALSEGRFILGVGSSHRVQVGPEHGVVYEHPIQRVRETVEIVRALLRDGEVSYRGETLSIKRFDLWFDPERRELPIYLAALFPKMLALCGEVGDGLVLTGVTLETAGRVAADIAAGAERAGRSPDAIDVTSLIPCRVADDRAAALDAMRPGIAQTAGSYPRYNRVLAESGFPEVAQQIREAWDRGDREAAARAVTDEVVLSRTVVGTASECRAQIEAFRQSGIALPIISPGIPTLEEASAVLEACAS